jgi:hypothetical protein
LIAPILDLPHNHRFAAGQPSNSSVTVMARVRIR